MAITFKSLGHALAVFGKEAKAVALKVEADLPKIEATKTEVEAVTDVAVAATGNAAAVPVANTIEDAAYAAIGELGSVLSTGGAAAESKLLDAGLDQGVINAIKAFIGGASQVVTLVKGASK